MIRWVQPARTEHTYLTIYGSQSIFDCCHTYMVNEEKREANRVRVGSTEQPTVVSPFSPDGRWRFAQTQLSRSVVVYLIPLPVGEIVRLPEEVGEGIEYFWSAEEPVLYYSRLLPKENMLAYYRVSPYEREPVQLTDPIFGFVRSTSQRGLPYTEFDPTIPLVYSMLVLFVAGGLSYWRKANIRF